MCRPSNLRALCVLYVFIRSVQSLFCAPKIIWCANSRIIHCEDDTATPRRRFMNGGAGWAKYRNGKRIQRRKPTATTVV